MLYFAYGSNLNLDRIRDRCSSARFLFIARLDGFRLDFTRFSTNNSCGAADIVHDPPASVWGVVYHINDEQSLALDKAEGVGVGAYKYFTVDVHPEGDRAQRIKALTYVVVNKEDARPKPSAAYKELIVAGAMHWKLPADYIEQLKRIETP
jgi:gamma-glutamylcyclotransferase (GGCT)/AIG2-like uncharacterized protein YtfP